MSNASTQVPELFERIVMTEGASAFDAFLDDQQPPLLMYITEEGVIVPRDGIYETLPGS